MAPRDIASATIVRIYYLLEDLRMMDMYTVIAQVYVTISGQVSKGNCFPVYKSLALRTICVFIGRLNGCSLFNLPYNFFLLIYLVWVCFGTRLVIILITHAKRILVKMQGS